LKNEGGHLLVQTNARPQDVHATILIEKLSEGWSPEHNGWPQELMRRFAVQLNATTELLDSSEENVLQFMLSMNDICLRGMSGIPCLVVGGDKNIGFTARKFLQNASAPGLLPFVFTLSSSTLETVRESFPNDRCLILAKEKIKQLLSADDAKLSLKQLLREQVSRRRLDPYDVLRPAEGGMFFGRQNEVARLVDEDTTSFAIAGPARIGKTSLLKRYRQEMVRRKDPRSTYRVLINFLDCTDTSPDGIARFIAFKIEASSKSYNMKPDALLKFLIYHSKDGPLDLLLDEVDLVCGSEAFKALGAAARDGLCRLILCGKEALLNAALSETSLLGCRLVLTQLEPLDETAATELIMRPLTDLGFEIIEPEKVIEYILRWTGRLPYLLQFFGQKLANMAIDENAHAISMEQVEALKWDFVTAQYFVKPLTDLDDPEARFIGLSLLKNKYTEFSVRAVSDLARRSGISLTHNRAREICNNLVINNVLAWKGGSYRIANEGLYFYALEAGYLDNALEEATQLINATSVA
jgi:hypothetical protein